tara:strand:- start:6042 stop:6230 length:189 start_codon:yes stop_codon:yes gene_type:complete
MAMIKNLQREVLSEDKWYLIMSAARDDVKEFGIDDEIFDKIEKKLEDYRKVSKAKNPLSSMF